jgi:hypothetical protein
MSVRMTPDEIIWRPRSANCAFYGHQRPVPKQAPPMDRSIGVALHRIALSALPIHAADTPCLLRRWRTRFNGLARVAFALNSPTACFARTDGQSWCAMENSRLAIAFRVDEGANPTGTKK